MARAGQSGIVEVHPNPQTIFFGGKYINRSALARSVAVHPSHISRIFSGDKVPSLSLARRISAEVGMSMDEFLQALDRHVYNNDTPLEPLQISA